MRSWLALYVGTVHRTETHLVVTHAEQEIGVRVLVDDSLDDFSLVDSKDSTFDVLFADHN